MKFPIVVSLTYQLTVLLPVAFFLYWKDHVWAYSFVLGAVVYIVPNLYFTLYAFRYRGAQHTQMISRSFSWGESGKLALAAVGFALIFTFVNPLYPPVLFAGYITMIVLQWLIGLHVTKHWPEAEHKDD